MIKTSLTIDTSGFNKGMSQAGKTASNSLKETSKAAKTAGGAIEAIGQKAASMAGPAGSAISSLTTNLAAMGPVGIAVGAVFATIALSIGAAITAASKLSTHFDGLAKSANSIGVTADAFSRLGTAARKAGSNSESVMKLITKLQDGLDKAAQGSEKYIDAFRAIGFEWGELAHKSPERAFLDIVDALKRIMDEGGQIPALFKSIIGNRDIRELQKLVSSNFSADFSAAPGLNQDTVSSSEEVQNLLQDLKSDFESQLSHSEGILQLLEAAKGLLTTTDGNASNLMKIVDWLAKYGAKTLDKLSNVIDSFSHPIKTIVTYLGFLVVAVETGIAKVLQGIGKIPGLGKVGEVGDALAANASQAEARVLKYYYDKDKPAANSSTPQSPDLTPSQAAENTPKEPRKDYSKTFTDVSSAAGSDTSSFLKDFYKKLDASGTEEGRAAAEKLMEDIQKAIDDSTSREDLANKIGDIMSGIMDRVPEVMKETLEKEKEAFDKRQKKLAQWKSAEEAQAKINSTIQEKPALLGQGTQNVFTTGLTSRGGFATGGYVERSSDMKKQLDIITQINSKLSQVTSIQRQHTGFFKSY